MPVSAYDDSGDAIGDQFDEDQDDWLHEQPREDAPQMHDGIPITGWYRGEPIPDLNTLPRERWLEVLRPLGFWPRTHALHGLRKEEDSEFGRQVSGRLILEGGAPRARLSDGAPPPMPAGDPPARGASRQVNFRLGPEEHARLAEAAKLFSMRPTTLARVLTMRGVNRALYEERRDR